MNVLIVSRDAGQIGCWLGALRPGHWSVVSASDWTEAKRMLPRIQVVLYDADHSVAPPAEVLAAAARRRQPVVVVASGLDASAWLGFYRQGAYDVVSLPAQPPQLAEAVESALRAAGALSQRQVRSWVVSAFEWARSRMVHSGGA